MQPRGGTAGCRSERTCQGTKKSGIYGHLRGWNIGGKIELFYCEIIENDFCRIYITGGSNGHHTDENITTYARNRKGDLIDYHTYRDQIEKLKDKFYQLREDDPLFKKQYKKGDFWKWYDKQGKT